MAAPVYFIGNTHRFRWTITKDGEAWVINSGYVNPLLIDPDGNVSTKTAIAENATSGIWYYDTVGGATGDLDEAGDWTLLLKVTDTTGSPSVQITGAPFLFEVDAVGNEA